MKKPTFPRQRIFVFAVFTFLLLLACNAPGIGNAVPRLHSAEQTARALETSIGQTQEAMLNNPITQIPQVDTSTPQPETPTLLAEITNPPEVTMTPIVEHNVIPGEP
jgi:Na+-transporting methylmalonyl-CoA/oxaloacetate decarboxylase gamma subunit